VKSNTVLFVFCCLLLGLSFANQSVVLLPSGEKCVAGQILIKLDPGVRGNVRLSGKSFGVPRLDAICRREGVCGIERIVRHPNPALAASGMDLLFLLSFAEDADIPRVISDFEKLPGVAGAWPNAVLDVCRTDQTPNDPRYGEQWHLPRIRASQAWDIAHGDSSVVIAVIDDGVECMLGDIQANIWINHAEDLNGNGRFDSTWYPDGDLDGVDQDGNGFFDDVIGYDFVGGDPIPMPESTDEHGTACWGVANAVTDNGIGIAAPPWNCRAMALRCGGSGSINMSAAVAAIGYGLDKGAWVFSMSFGSATPYEPLNAACQAVWAAGALSVAAAGSSDTCYPAAFDNVVAVAASDSNDRRAAFSAYGSWVDVCAPGVQILTTSRNGYEYYGGTSVAAPIVAGVLAWFKSAYPDITNDSALALLYNCCDSMPDSLYRTGLLGHGRVAMTDSAIGGAAEPQQAGAIGFTPRPSIMRGVLLLGEGPSAGTGSSYLMDISGRKVMNLRPGANDVRALAPGVYFVETGTRGRTKVVKPR
jgi:subtilisin family serine protease